MRGSRVSDTTRGGGTSSSRRPARARGVQNGNAPLLEVQNLHVRIHSRNQIIHAVNGASFEVYPGETLAIVGESGCGKSITALSILGLAPKPQSRIDGAIRFMGVNLVDLSERELRRIRGNEISMIFQEPMTSLNPVHTVGQQISEVLVEHKDVSTKAALREAARLLDLVHIPAAGRRIHEYPHQLSGGMRQRVMIAMALACEPKILIADEPTTALDVTIQAQILDLLREIQDELGTAIILITHDMGVVAENAKRVIVMYAGYKVEEASVEHLFARPAHPYTKGLLESIPGITKVAGEGRRVRLNEIKGVVPSLGSLPPGCPFSPRCAFATQLCQGEMPPLEETSPSHRTACWHSSKLQDETSP